MFCLFIPTNLRAVLHPYVVTQSLKQLKKHIKEWALDCKGWHIANDPKVYDLSRIDDEKIHEEEYYDGFSAVCTTLDDPASMIVSINKRRWEIKTAFRVMKSEFRARPVYVRKDERIKAHFLTCFLALLMLRILEHKLGGEYTTEEIISTLKAHSLRKIDGIGYIPAFERTALTDKLHDISSFRTDSEIITDHQHFLTQ